MVMMVGRGLGRPVVAVVGRGVTVRLVMTGRHVTVVAAGWARMAVAAVVGFAVTRFCVMGRLPVMARPSMMTGPAVAAVPALPMMGGVGGRGHRGVPGHVVGIVEWVGRVAVGIVLGGGRAGDGEEDAGEGGQLGEGEFHGRSLEDWSL